MENQLLQVGGAVALIALVVRELFAYLKSKDKNESDKDSGVNDQIFSELQRMNNNHLTHINEAINSGNQRLIDAIHGDNTKIIELLGEIKGHLSSRR